MNINIDYQSRIPIYEQIVREVENLVALDLLQKNQQIPSIRELACTLGINPNTVKKAYDLLEHKGIIISKSTKGTFITDNVETAKRQKIEMCFQEIEKQMKELEHFGYSKEEILKKL